MRFMYWLITIFTWFKLTVIFKHILENCMFYTPAESVSFIRFRKLPTIISLNIFLIPLSLSLLFIGKFYNANIGTFSYLRCLICCIHFFFCLFAVWVGWFQLFYFLGHIYDLCHLVCSSLLPEFSENKVLNYIFWFHLLYSSLLFVKMIFA